MEVRLPFDFFRVPAGTPFYLIEDTYELNVCDVCGKKRKCDLKKDEGAHAPSKVSIPSDKEADRQEEEGRYRYQGEDREQRDLSSVEML